jgi:uncharacterized protein YjbI with pentapeptide repeats
MNEWAGKTPTADQWRDILEKHARWLSGSEGGTRAVLTRAVLTGAVLTGADLTGAVLTRADLTRAVLTRAVLRDAVLTGAVLTRAVLTGAVLTGADLTGAVLTGAVLRDADLTRAVLTGADLTRAVLTGAVLTGAVLTRAVLTRAVLTRAVLTRADLTRAVLTRADLTRAVLTRAVLRDADLRPIRDDLWAVLSSAPAEAAALRAALVAGTVDGSTYEGPCACLVGTLAKARGCRYDAIPGLAPNGGRPAEHFFLSIRKGDTPETSQAAKIALAWVDDWLGRMRAAFGHADGVSA